MGAGLKSSYSSPGGRHDLGSGSPVRGAGLQRMHREQGFKASEGCIGVSQEAKGIPGRWKSRSKGSGVGMYNV